GDTAITTQDLDAGKVQHTLTGATGTVARLAWSPDGKTLACCCTNSALLLWEPPSGRAAQALIALPSGHGVALSPEGHYRGTPQAERLLRYVVQTDAGQDTLTTEEFSAKYGWKNDPEKVRSAEK